MSGIIKDTSSMTNPYFLFESKCGGSWDWGYFFYRVFKLKSKDEIHKILKNWHRYPKLFDTPNTKNHNIYYIHPLPKGLIYILRIYGWGNGYGEPDSSSLHPPFYYRCHDNKCSSIKIFDMVYTDKYRLDIFNEFSKCTRDCISHPYSNVYNGKHIQPSLTESRATNNYQCFGHYGRHCFRTWHAIILPPGTYTLNGLYIPLTPDQCGIKPGNYTYFKHAKNQTITVDYFIAHLGNFKIHSITKPQFKVETGKLISNITLLAYDQNKKPVWINKGENNFPNGIKLTIDTQTITVPPIPHVISNVHRDHKYIYFTSNYNGKAKITFSKKSITYPVHKGDNKIEIDYLKKILGIVTTGNLCINPL